MIFNDEDDERFYIQICDGCKENPETCGKWFVDCEQERDESDGRI